MNMHAATSRLDEIMQALQDYAKHERPTLSYDLGAEFLRIAALVGSFRGETRAGNEPYLTFTLAEREVCIYDCPNAKGWLRSILARLAVLTDEFRFPREYRMSKDRDKGFIETNPYGFEATFDYPTPQGTRVPFYIETCNGMPKTKTCGTYFFALRRLDAYNYAF